MTKLIDNEFRDCECSKNLRKQNYLIMVSNRAEEKNTEKYINQ